MIIAAAQPKPLTAPDGYTMSPMPHLRFYWPDKVTCVLQQMFMTTTGDTYWVDVPKASAEDANPEADV